MVITVDDADVCDVDPGHPVAVTVTVSLRRMVEVWRGDSEWSDAIRSGNLALLCHHHHYLKTYEGWTLEPPGSTDTSTSGWSFTPLPPFGEEPDPPDS